MKNILKTMLCGAAVVLLLTVPAMAEKITEPLDFTSENPLTHASFTWDDAARVLTLHNGFEIEVTDPDLEDDESVNAIMVPDGTTVVLEGSAKITTDCYGIMSAGDLTVVGSDSDNKLEIDATSGLYTYASEITIHNCNIVIKAEVGIKNGYGEEKEGDITVTDSTLDIQVGVLEDYATSGADGLSCGGMLTIDNSDIAILSANRGIFGGELWITDSKLYITSMKTAVWADALSGSSAIIDSTLNITSKYSACFTGNGIYSIQGSTLDLTAGTAGIICDYDTSSVSIDNCRLKSVCGTPCFKIKDLAITNSSLDITSQNGCLFLSKGKISIDEKFVLYGKNGRRVSFPIKYSDELFDYVVKTYSTSTGYQGIYHIWYYNGIPVNRLVTAADTTVYIESVFRSLRDITFSGEGTETLPDLCRALGSTVNLKNITPAARKGYAFTGWYTDAACTEAVTKIVVIGDMELYAGWEEIPAEEEAASEM